MLTEREKAEKARDEALPHLRELVAGKKTRGFKCNCGAIHHGEGIMLEIEPGGGEYFYQVADWYMWSIKVRDVDTVFENDTDFSYSCGFEFFGKGREAKELLEASFSHIDKDKLYEEYKATV